MKQKILGSAIGNAALFLRNKLEILHTAWCSPERVGTLANDQLATQLVTTLCLPQKTFIDVGAHIGSIIAAVSRHDPSIKIIAIEAIPEKIAALRIKFPFVELHDCAVGESTGEVTFYVHTRQSGYSSLGRPDNMNKDAITEITVPIKRLDDLVASNDVDCIKIDVEGAELGVLRGCPNLLKSSRPVIMFESGPEMDDGLKFTKKDLYEFLDANRYAIVIPNRVAHNDPGLTQEGFIESHLYPRRTTNYFAIPIERRAEIRDRARTVLKTQIGLKTHIG